MSASSRTTEVPDGVAGSAGGAEVSQAAPVKEPAPTTTPGLAGTKAASDAFGTDAVVGHTNPADDDVDPAAVKCLPFGELACRIGPGFILAGIQLGPGSLTTSAMLGAVYGYNLLWILLPVIFMGATFILVSYRLSMMTGMPTIAAIRKYYGNAAAGFVGIICFLSCMFFNIGNIAGIGAGMNLIFGIDWRIGACIIWVLVMLIYFSKGVYDKIEKGVMAALVFLTLSFLVALVMGGGVDGGKFVTGLTRWSFPEGSLVTVLGFLGSSASVLAGMYGTYLGSEKGWNKRDFYNGVMTADAATQVFGTVLISGLILLVGAVIVNPMGGTIKTASDLATLLVPVLGGWSALVMGIALLAAAFAAIMGNTGRCVVFLNAGLNKATGLDSKNVKVSAAALLVFALVVCMIFGGNPVQLVYFSNVATSIATPVAGLFITLMIYRKDLGGKLAFPRGLRVCMTISYACYAGLMLFALYQAVPKFLGSVL